MGLSDILRLRRRTSAIAAAEDVDIGRPVAPPAGNIAPALVSQMEAGMSNPLAFQAMGGCLTREIALAVPAVRRGVRVITTAIAQMPLTRWRGMDPMDPGPYLQQPEPSRAYVTTLTLTVEDLIMHPHAWWMVVHRDAAGYPLNVRRLEPELVTVETEYATGEVTRQYVAYQGRQVPQRDLIRFDGPDLGILRLGIVEILTALRLEMAARMYADPEVPSGYWKNSGEYPMKRDEITTFMAEWRAARARGSSAFANGSVDWVSVFMQPDQLQLVQGREEASAQIARLLNLPARYANAKSADSMTYSTIATEHRDLYDLSLQCYMAPIAQRLSMPDLNGTPRGQRVAFDADVFLRSEPRDRAEVGEILIRSGQSTAEEQRQEQGKPPLPTEEDSANAA
ncbi:phage portal protein [Streptomyces sp. WMMC500]|uniref:phage portal protein n=1 Tax=Streptomyces sp. WMMC500 TaxID=3015154 RepID=UPI00248D382A|nr:phage portal protein [Streptomyces sp. WMMC500]WBB59345.1 phage portal protein [Streptomyces sp. WMMC500]